MRSVCLSVSLLTVLLVGIAMGFGSVGEIFTVVAGGGFVGICMWAGGWAQLDSLGGCDQFSGRGFAKEYCTQGLDGNQFVQGSFLDACNGIGEACHCVKDPVGGGDSRYWYGVVAKRKGVGDALAPRVCHDNTNAAVVLCRVCKVPSLGCMVAPGFVFV